MPSDQVSAQEILQVVRLASQESRKISITFSSCSDDLYAVSHLLGMDGHAVTLPAGTKNLLIAIVRSGQWKEDDHRTFVLELGPGFDQQLFASRLAGALEKIEIV